MSLLTHPLLLIPSLGVLVLLLAVKLYFHLSKGVFRSTADLTGRVILLTGGNTGIGEAYVREIASRGATVIMAVRNVARGKTVAEAVRAATGNERISVQQCDLGSLASVRSSAERLRATVQHLDVFVIFAAAVGEHSAEGAQARMTASPDGLEVQFQCNYLAHFLLLQLLWPLLIKSKLGARVVVTSSAAHLMGSLDLENIARLERNPKRHVYMCYADSKLALVALTRELAQRLENNRFESGNQVSVNAFSPGTVLTNGITHNYFWWIRILLRVLAFLYGRSVDDGAQTMLMLTMSEDTKLTETSGGYYADCRLAPHNKLADDQKLRAQLWEMSLNLLTQKGHLFPSEVDPLLR